MPFPKKDRRTEILNVGSERRSQGRDRRQSRRILVDLEVDYKCEDTYLFAYITDMSAMGIFIRTNNPEGVGTRLNLRFVPPGGTRPLALEGEVQWINPYRPGDFTNISPGMGVEFVNLSTQDKYDLMELVRKIAYLENIDEDDDSSAEDEEESAIPFAQNNSASENIDEHHAAGVIFQPAEGHLVEGATHDDNICMEMSSRNRSSGSTSIH